ncbi:hypothetical protein V6R21_07915 [Limibacter armeniacum]|uniref:hypothetical protein n=1 Tax=Limibacter armeniacum TaxID=466084 RepID=UPI002FE675AD
MEGYISDFDHRYADYLSDKDLKQIQEFEKKTGKVLLAYYSKPRVAELSDEELNMIKKLEEKLCIRIVAYEGFDPSRKSS